MLWVVLPVFNEAEAIETVIQEWLPVLEKLDESWTLGIVTAPELCCCEGPLLALSRSRLEAVASVRRNFVEP